MATAAPIPPMTFMDKGKLEVSLVAGPAGFEPT